MKDKTPMNRRTGLRKKKQSTANNGPKEDKKKDPKEEQTKVIPEQFEEFSHEIPDEKAEEANEVKPKGTEQNENRP